MDEQALRDLIAHWGYQLLPKPHPDSLGFGGLVVAIRDRPTDEHYDPEWIRLRQFDRNDTLQWVVLGRSPPAGSAGPVAVGYVELDDRYHKKVDFFTFGGQLQIATLPHMTLYVLHGEAPLLAPTDPDSSAGRLQGEVESWLAREEARWGGKDFAFDQRLAQVKPFTLYIASVHTLLQRYSAEPRLRRHYQRLDHELRQEKKWLEEMGRWPIRPPTLDELLGPGVPYSG